MKKINEIVCQESFAESQLDYKSLSRLSSADKLEKLFINIFIS